MTKPIYADDIVLQRYVKVWWGQFECPYCHKTWQRGGHKEGFVKAAAFQHVAACWEIVLFDAGYALHQWLQTGRTVVPIADAPSVMSWWPRDRRSILAAKRRRAREGLTPRRP